MPWPRAVARVHVVRGAPVGIPWPTFACVALVVLGVAWACWPGLDGGWGRDDFMQLAIARMVGSPWPLFMQDHYPVPGAVFRPLGFASMWLDTALFGTSYRGHAAVDLALHAGVALALFAALRRFAVPRLVALAITLLFALHPATVGTAQWWSARFDVLATLCVLLAVGIGMPGGTRRSPVVLVACLVAGLAAMASKETGLVVAPALTMLWWPARDCSGSDRRRAWMGIAAAWLVAGLFLGWRTLVLGTPASALTGTESLAPMLARGLVGWAGFAPGYFSFAVRLDSSARVLLAAAGWLAAMLALHAWVRRRPADRASPPMAPETGRLAACGTCLLLLPALLQAPVTALNAAGLQAGASAVAAAMQSRLYYLGLAGAALLLAALLTRLQVRMAPHWRVLALLPALLGIAAFAPAARETSAAFARVSHANAALAQEAVAAVDRLHLPDSGCRIAFAGVTPPPEWDIYVSMDSILKALARDRQRIGHCVVEANYPTWFSLFSAPFDPADAAPSLPLVQGGQMVPWLHAGGLVVGYLEPPAAAFREDDGRTLVLEWRDGRFVEAPRVPAGQGGPRAAAE